MADDKKPDKESKKAPPDKSPDKGPPPDMLQEGGPPAQPKAEPYGATLLRQIHEDQSLLLQEYDELMQVLDNPAVHKLVTKTCMNAEKTLTDIETLFSKTYPDLEPISDGMDVPPEGDAPPMEDDGSDPTSGGKDLSGAEAADSGQQPPVPPDEAWQASKRLKYRRKSMEQNTPALEQNAPEIQTLCRCCGNQPTGEEPAPYQNQGSWFSEEHHGPHLQEALAHANEMLENGYQHDDEGRMKSFHFHKVLEPMAMRGIEYHAKQKGMKSDDLPNYGIGRTPPGFRMDAYEGKLDEALESEANYQRNSDEINDTLRFQGETRNIVRESPKYPRKDMGVNQGAQMGTQGQVTPSEQHDDPEFNKSIGHCHSIANAASFFGQMSREKAFGWKHREQAGQTASILDAVLADLMGREQQLDPAHAAQATFDPNTVTGQTGEKAGHFAYEDELPQETLSEEEIARISMPSEGLNYALRDSQQDTGGYPDLSDFRMELLDPNYVPEARADTAQFIPDREPSGYKPLRAVSGTPRNAPRTEQPAYSSASAHRRQQNRTQQDTTDQGRPQTGKALGELDEKGWRDILNFITRGPERSTEGGTLSEHQAGSTRSAEPDNDDIVSSMQASARRASAGRAAREDARVRREYPAAFAEQELTTRQPTARSAKPAASRSEKPDMYIGNRSEVQTQRSHNAARDMARSSEWSRLLQSEGGAPYTDGAEGAPKVNRGDTAQSTPKPSEQEAVPAKTGAGGKPQKVGTGSRYQGTPNPKYVEPIKGPVADALKRGAEGKAPSEKSLAEVKAMIDAQNKGMEEMMKLLATADF